MTVKEQYVNVNNWGRIEQEKAYRIIFDDKEEADVFMSDIKYLSEENGGIDKNGITAMLYQHLQRNFIESNKYYEGKPSTTIYSNAVTKVILCLYATLGKYKDFLASLI